MRTSEYDSSAPFEPEVRKRTPDTAMRDMQGSIDVTGPPIRIDSSLGHIRRCSRTGRRRAGNRRFATTLAAIGRKIVRASTRAAGRAVRVPAMTNEEFCNFLIGFCGGAR